MKSRTLFFDRTVFKKNLTRFSPAWALFAVWMCLAVFTNCSFSVGRAGSNLMGLGEGYCIYAFLFAPLCAQLLFGDLYNSRMCYALHAMPLRRETWFGTNILSGFVFHLIPAVSATVLAGLMLGILGYEGNMAVVPLFLLTTTLQYIFFFAIAVFSIFCVGSRFAHAVVYLLLNVGSLIVQWLVSSLYTPLFYGIQTNPEPFMLFAPIAQMMEAPFLKVETVIVTGNMGSQMTVDTKNILPGDGFAYYFFAAAAGVLLLLGALWLYRRRKLECAGDFLAIRGIGPVFSLIFTLTIGAFFHVVTDGLFLLVGLVVGWFTSQMLLNRTVRVFQKKNFGRCAAVIGVFLLTILIASLDPLGIEKWIPETEKVEAVSITEGHYGYTDPTVTLEEQEDIENVIAIHRDCLEAHQEDFYRRAGGDLLITYKDEDGIALTFSYKLKNGRTVNRYYYVRGVENTRYMKKLFSTQSAVFGEVLTEEEFLEKNSFVTIRDTRDNKERNFFDKADMRSLYQALLADCEEGTMVQSYTWRDYGERLYRLKFGDGLTIYVYADSENTLRWLRDQGLDVDARMVKE